MSNTRKPQNSLPLQLSFLVFSMLLNSIALIILKYSEKNTTYSKLGLLEAFKDIPIVIGSLLFVNIINKYGNKKSLIFALSLVSLCCLFMPYINDFWFIKLWFAVIGFSFAISKISVFAIIHTNEKEEKYLSKTMSKVEASFMIGIFGVNLGFAWLINSQYSTYWKFGFWGIGLIAIIAIWSLIKSKFEEKKIVNKKENLKKLREIFTKKNRIILTIIFLVVFVEQCINSWLPVFYKNNLGVISFYALQSTAFFALFSFAGRYMTSKIIIYTSWKKYIITCLTIILSIMIYSQILLIDLNKYLWIIICILPLLGLFLAPLYPLYNSKFLIDIPTDKTNISISLIMITSSLGSSIGSICMSIVFQMNFNHYFILLTSIPIVIILGLTMIFNKRII